MTHPGRIIGLLSLTGLLLVAGGCKHCDSGVPFVAVREALIRAEVDLPLGPADRERLLGFLRAKGNQEFVGEPPQDPTADQRYGPLLDLLASPENLEPADLTSPLYRPWFTGTPQRQVIDAREDAPPTLDPPFAMTDGPYWWVFKRGDEDTFNKLIVFKSMQAPAEPPGVR